MSKGDRFEDTALYRSLLCSCILLSVYRLL